MSLMPSEATMPVSDLKRRAATILADAPPPTFEYIDVASVRGDEYQRELNPARVHNIVTNFSAHLMQPIEVSRRKDGTVWCFDGQHRLAAARSLGQPVIGAMVHVGLTREQEATLFWTLQRVRWALTAWSGWRARIIGEEPIAVAIDKAVLGLGLTYGRDSHAEIQALVALERLYDQGGIPHLRDTLTLIREIWPSGTNRAFDRDVMLGMGHVLRQCSNLPQWDRDRMVERLSLLRPVDILREMKDYVLGTTSSYSRSYVAARVVIDRYNVRLLARKRLPPLKSTGGRLLPGLKDEP